VNKKNKRTDTTLFWETQKITSEDVSKQSSTHSFAPELNEMIIFVTADIKKKTNVK